MFFVLCVYSFFLSITSTSKTSVIIPKMNSPTIAGMKYWSATDGGVSVGAGVASTASTPNAVVACDG